MVSDITNTFDLKKVAAKTQLFALATGYAILIAYHISAEYFPQSYTQNFMILNTLNQNAKIKVNPDLKSQFCASTKCPDGVNQGR